MAELRRLRQVRKQVSHVLIRQIYRDTRGIDICKQDKGTIEELKHGQDDKSLTYGEIVSTSFETILGDAMRLLGRDADIVFYDLGSGTGKACLTAVLCYPGVVRSVGLELVPSLHNAASQCLSRLLAAVQQAAQAPGSAGKPGSLALGADKTAPRGAPKKGSVGQVLSAGELVDVVLAELRRLAAEAGTEQGGCAEARLANAVCLAMGQKDFKASFRAGTNGTFHRFLSVQPAFSLYEADGAVQVRPSELKAPAQKEALAPAPLGAAEADASDSADAAVVEVAAGPDLLVHTLSQAYVRPALRPLGAVQLEAADIFERLPAWHAEADIAYCASLLFTDDMMQRLCEQAVRMRPGSVLVSLKALPLQGEREQLLQLRSQSFYQFSWQKAEVYMYQVRK